jgi:23S rRNA pseudouridine1911/1915/1917 synthase
MAAARRKAEATSATSVEDQLQDILGSDFRILLETDQMYIINKPSGIACFHKHSTTAGKIKKGKGNADVSLEEALLHVNLPLSTINSEARGLVHRLDRGTSGCLAIAKSDEAHAQLVTEFFLRQVSKKYICLVSPAVERSSEQATPILIDTPVSGHVAKSKYRVLKSFDEASLVEMETLTGRKHQVRVHAAEVLKSPIIGDPLYSADATSSMKLIQHAKTPNSFFLHAASIQVPFSGRETIEAPIPEWWSSALNTL